MKGELAARAVALAALARSGEPPPGDVVLVAEADEESNTFNVGMSWLVRERPDLRCDYALNESGGWLLPLADGRKVVTISIGEKRVSSIRLRFFGKAAHASVPSRADNPVGIATEAVQKLLDLTAPPGEVPAVERALDALGVSAERRRGDGRLGPRAEPGAGGHAAGDDPAHRDPDGAADLRARQRDPAVRRRDLRRPRAARPGRGRRPRARRAGAGRRGGLRARVHGAARGRAPSRRSTPRCTSSARPTSPSGFPARPCSP